MEDGDNIIWKDKTGTYKLGYSQKLMREQIQWQKINFAGKVALISVIILLILVIVYVLYRLDQVNFFSTVMYK